MNSEVESVSNPMTPEQSKAQVVDGAQEIVRTLNLHVVTAYFRHSSCNDDGDAPFRGRVIIGYPPAQSFAESDAEIATMVQHLQSIGWTGDPDFSSHGTVVHKNNIVAVFGPQNVSSPNRDIELFGECRDVTTTKETKDSPEAITFD